MKICVLQPDYGPSNVDYQHYDPRRDLTAILPGHTVHHVAINKLTTHRQLKRLSTEGYDVFVNLCEGYLDWEVPSIDVIESLERLNLPYTGPPPTLYDPSKPLMKYVAYTTGVATPKHAIVKTSEALERGVAGLRYPLFVKPAHAGDSLGVDEGSRVLDADALATKVRATIDEYGEALIEEYITGRELTVLVISSPDPDLSPTALTPVEFIFPTGLSFKTYKLKTSELHPEANVPVRDPELVSRLKDAAIAVFRAFGGVGYARMDFRLDDAGTLFFLEINFTCSVFYRDGYEGSADYILAHDGLGQSGFAERIIAEGIARHRRKQRPYEMRGDAVSGYGIFATAPIAAGDIVFRGEERAHRLVTRRRASRWSAEDQATFRRYAYPISSEVFAFWDEDPTSWAPQNHSCDANTRFDGLDVVATRPIAKDEELTLDYSATMTDLSEPFDCNCRSKACKGVVRGRAENSVTSREAAKR